MIHEKSPLAHFDNRAKRVVDLARQNAEGRRDDAITAEHLLLAVLAVRHGLAARAVANLSGSCARLENALAAMLSVGQRPLPAHIPFTAAVEEAVVRAADQAKLLRDEQIGTEHLLLGLLVATDNAAVREMGAFGVDYSAVRAEIERLRAE